MIPERFLEIMSPVFGDDIEKYIEAVGKNRETALRINTVKCVDVAEIAGKLPFDCEKVPYCDNCFYFDFEKPGNLALHHAGAFYVQEPSAMTPVASVYGLLPDGVKVLDSCASPGGKTSQAVCMLSDTSVVVSNEIVPSRCKTLVGNIERQGFKNCIVLNSDTEYLSRVFKNEFALVICDAPCSGEGMFRKSEEACSEWSEENVELCAARQREILDNLSVCVAEGGYLLYSTCTFSPQENEMNVSLFLKGHPDFTVVKPNESVCNATVGGIEEYCHGFESEYVRRFYPHKGRGEGQFFALLKKNGELVPSTTFSYRDGSRPLTKDESAAVKEFLSSAVNTTYSNIRAYGDNILILPDGMTVPDKKVFCCGVKLGECKNRRIVPHHQFFSAYGRDFINRIELEPEGDLCRKYLRGEGFEYDAPDGWAAVTVNGIPLGGAKVVGGYVKNHYPKGLRTLS